MAWDSLRNFQTIFDRADFTYISNHDTVLKSKNSIRSIIVDRIPSPSSSDSVYRSMVQDYLNNVKSFYSWFGNSNSDMNTGCTSCEAYLYEVLQLFNQPSEIRTQTSSRCIKLNNNFLWSLGKIMQGIRHCFNKVLIPQCINPIQIIRYIFDSNEGFGKKFLYNSKGEHSFSKKIYLLSKQKLLVVLRLLSNPSGSQVRTFNKWRDLGRGDCPVRILVEHHMIKRDRVFFLYRANEHNEYSAQLAKPSDKVQFN